MEIFTHDQGRAYRTARFTERAHAFQSHLPKPPVRIVFIAVVYNAFHRRHECLFACYLNDDDTTLIGTYFQNALIDFQQ